MEEDYLFYTKPVLFLDKDESEDMDTDDGIGGGGVEESPKKGKIKTKRRGKPTPTPCLACSWRKKRSGLLREWIRELPSAHLSVDVLNTLTNSLL